MAGITFTFGSGVADSVFGKSQAPIRSFLEKRGEAFEQASLVKELFNVYKTKNWGDKFGGMTGMDGFKPGGENAAFPTDHMEEGFSKVIEYTEWRDSFSVSRKAADDGNIIDLKKRPLGFIAGYFRTREKFAASIFGAAMGGATSHKFGGMTFDLKCADGKGLFATDHPSKLGKTKQCNVFSDEFNEDSLGALETAMQNVMGDNDEILDISPDTIVIPNDYELKKAVFAAIGSDKDPSTSNNGFNYHFGRWNIIVHPYLNQFIAKGTKPWMLLDSNANKAYDGAVWGDRVSLEVESRIDAGTKANVWDGYARFGAGFNDWRPFAVGGVSGGQALT